MLDESGNMDDGLLVKYLLGETEDQETRLLEQWLEDSEENRQYFQEFRKVWEGTAQPEFKVDVDAAWNTLSGRIEAEEEKPAKEPILRRLEQPNWNWVAAAMIAVMIGSFSFFRLYFGNEQSQTTAAGEIIEQVLPDGSSIALNGNSTISYPRQFDQDIREVKLEGEAFFEVEPDASKPFVIDAGAGEIKVLGTSFNVEAYADNDLRVQVVSGRVQLSLPGDSDDSSMVILEAGNTGIIDMDTRRVYKENPLYDDALFWLNKRLVFEKTPLPRVFEILSRNYKVNFSNYQPEVESCLLTARFEKESIDAILEVISATFNVQFSIEDDQITVSSEENNCVEG